MTLTDKQIAEVTILSEKSQTNIESHQPTRLRFWEKAMPPFRHLMFTFALIAFLGFAYASAVDEPPKPQSITDNESYFQELLAGVSDSQLHQVLHEFVSAKYKHGVYPEDRTAIKVVHQDEPAMATSLVELAKRQNTNTTTTSTPVTTSISTSILTTSEAPTTLISSTTPSSTITSTSTSEQPTPSVSLPSPSASSSIETQPQSSSTTDAPQTTSSVRATTSSSSETLISSVSSSSFSSIISSTSNNAAQSTSSTALPSTTVRPSSTRENIYTTTLPNGGVQTITSITVVPADQATAVTTPTPTVTPSLQTGAAAIMGRVGAKEVLGVVGAAVCFVWAL